MTVPGGGFPDGTFGADLSVLNGLDEASWRAALNRKVIGSSGGSGGPGTGFNGLFGGIGAVIGGIADAIRGLAVPERFEPVGDAFQDYQRALNERVDLLDEVSG